MRVVYDEANPPPKGGLECKDKSLTRQSEAADADINVIVKRFEQTGVMPVDQREALFMDVSDVGDFRQIRDHVNFVNEAFMQLPAELRARFDNDPSVFLDFTSDPANRSELVKLGLLPKEVETTPPISAASSPAGSPSAGGVKEPPVEGPGGP